MRLAVTVLFLLSHILALKRRKKVTWLTRKTIVAPKDCKPRSGVTLLGLTYALSAQKPAFVISEGQVKPPNHGNWKTPGFIPNAEHPKPYLPQFPGKKQRSLELRHLRATF